MLPQNAALEDLHGDPRTIGLAGRHKILETNASAIGITNLVRQHIPRPRTGEKKIRRHGKTIHKGNNLAERRARLGHRPSIRISRPVNIAIGNQMRIPYIAFKRRPKRALGGTVVDHRQNTLEPPLLTLRHILLRSARRSDVAIKAFEKNI